MRKLALILLLFCAATPAFAQTPSFEFPAACTAGLDCWIVNYVDVDKKKDEAKDFTCGHQTYDEHNGTDIALPDLVTTDKGVPVYAAADGKVLRIRDGLPDREVTEEQRQKMLADNTGCGNGVFIDNGAGWQTIYCHMKKDSIVVKAGQQVKAGDTLGQIGESGIAEFPHLHFGVFFENNAIDPFTGHDAHTACGTPGKSLWDPALNLSYNPVAIYATGFKNTPPDFEQIKIDTTSPASLPVNGDALVFWASMYGVNKGDKIHIEISDPQGRIFSQRDITQEKDRARQFYYIGRKTTENPPTSGTYTGRVRLERTLDNGQTLERHKSRTLLMR